MYCIFFEHQTLYPFECGESAMLWQKCHDSVEKLSPNRRNDYFLRSKILWFL